jgi:hypothetical protein
MLCTVTAAGSSQLLPAAAWRPHLAAVRLGQLDSHVAQATQAHHANLHACSHHHKQHPRMKQV